AVRDDLVASAVRFLKDPKVQAAPLAKRISFLETKGMTSAEIETALAQANGAAAPAAPAVLAPAAPHMSQAVVPAKYQWTWKDYALGGIGAAGISYGVFMAASKYLVPLLNFPTSTAVQKDTERIESQLESANKAVELVRVQTADVIKAVESHAEDLTKSLEGMTASIKDLQDADEKRAAQIEQIEQEIESLRTTMPRMIERNKENQSAMLAELQTELKSLKSLLLNRRLAPAGGASPNTSGLPTAGGLPAIPAWQLEAA
ncbi:peroxisomal membrane anchor protein conserved region-domain-containing protein, partial [Entophlyctis helioformis]